jgi:hypothetical protein
MHANGNVSERLAMHMKLAAVVGSILGFAFAGCSTNASKLSDVRIGMTKPEIVGLLGEPHATTAQANTEYLTYYLSQDPSVRDQLYMVRIVDHKVESFGRFLPLLEVYNRPINGGSPLALGALMPFTVNTDIVTQLQQLKALKDQGVLTDEEFQRAKQRLLGPVE